MVLPQDKKNKNIKKELHIFESDIKIKKSGHDTESRE